MLEELRIVGAVAVALLLGGVIGLEREVARRPAGLRTHMLVAGAACLFVSLGMAVQSYVVNRVGANADDLIRADPVRVIEAVVTGISFLGAGTILRGRDANRVEGLTTAATILMAAAVGVAVAIEHWIVALGVVLLVLITTRGMYFLERRVTSSKQ